MAGDASMEDPTRAEEEAGTDFERGESTRHFFNSALARANLRSNASLARFFGSSAIVLVAIIPLI